MRMRIDYSTFGRCAPTWHRPGYTPWLYGRNGDGRSCIVRLDKRLNVPMAGTRASSGLGSARSCAIAVRTVVSFLRVHTRRDFGRRLPSVRLQESNAHS